MSKVWKEFTINDKTFTLAFNLDELDREEIVEKPEAVAEDVTNDMTDIVDPIIGRGLKVHEFNEIEEWVREEIENLIDREGLRKGTITLCLNYEHATSGFGWYGGEPDLEGVDEDRLENGFFEMNDGEWLSNVWDEVERRLADEINEAHAEIKWETSFQKWNGGPLHGRLTCVEGPERVEKVAEEMEELFHKIVEADQKAYWEDLRAELVAEAESEE